MQAIDAVRQGAPAATLESQFLDFKEEQGTNVGGKRRFIDPRDDAAATQIAGEVACFANTEHGGVIVVGVNDKGVGPAAFVGAYLNTDYLRERVYELTNPHYSLDLIEEVPADNGKTLQAGGKIYVINIAPSSFLTACKNQMQERIGKQCLPLTADRARETLDRRRNYDWSAEKSSTRVSDVDPDALRVAVRLYEREQARRIVDPVALMRRLRLTADEDGTNPTLLNAGALLFTASEPDNLQIDARWARVESVPAHAHLRESAPLLLAIERAHRWLVDEVFKPEPVVVGFQRQPARRVSEAALREVVVNAAMHRDYLHHHGRIVITVLGDPAHTIKVRSPGGFPPGVAPNRLLSTPSRPRNSRLAEALRTLGLADTEGIGIATLYREMLRHGHAEPEIGDQSGDVLCVLAGGSPDSATMALFDEIDAKADVGKDVTAAVAVACLLRMPVLHPDDLAATAQTTVGEAERVLDALVSAGVLDKITNHGRAFRFTRSTRERLQHRLAYRRRMPLDEHWEVVRAYLETEAVLSAEDAAKLLQVTRVQASRILSELRDMGRLGAVANVRGRGVRYRQSS